MYRKDQKTVTTSDGDLPVGETVDIEAGLARGHR